MTSATEPSTPLERDQDAERPKFLARFPQDPELAVIVEAFERGNHDYVRREAPRLAERAESGAVREAARELRRRVDPDPLFKLLVLLAFALLAFLVWWAYGRQP